MPPRLLQMMSYVWRARTLSGLLILFAFLLHAAGDSVAKPILPRRGLPISSTFEEDRSAPGALRYAWRGSGVRASLEPGGTVLLTSGDGPPVQITFPGANIASTPQGESPNIEKTFYYIGSPENWRSASHFDRVRYAQLYPGIDLVFVINAGQLEFNFEISPHADPRLIRIHYEARVSLDHAGNLHAAVSDAEIIQRRPHAFQAAGPSARDIDCSYRLKGDSDVVLQTAGYNRNAALTVDPVLIFSTYLGGPAFNAIYGATSDAAGNLYLAGETASGSLSNSSVPARSSDDAFIAKVNSAGSQLLYTVYLGGSENDSAKAVAVDASGNAYVTGVTASTDFPTTSGALSTHNSGTQNAFVSKLDPSGHLLYSTFLGGEKSDTGFSIAVDAGGNAYVAGQTGSILFPVTSGTFQPSNAGGLADCFVSKLNPAGSGLVYSTFIGGSALDSCSGLAIDASGSAYLTGTTYSTDFPTQTPLQGSLLGNANAFVAKLNPAGSALVYSTFLGGSSTDESNGIAIDSSGAVYVAGDTSSPDFPVTYGSVQLTLNGSYNAFVAKLSSSGAALVYSTFLGGSQSDTATSIAVDQTGRAILGGFTSSPNFPIAGATQATFQGAFDAFASVLDPSGATLVYRAILAAPAMTAVTPWQPCLGTVFCWRG